MNPRSQKMIFVTTAVTFMLVSVGFQIADFGLGIDGARKWGAITFTISTGIICLPLLVYVTMLFAGRLKPSKAEQKEAEQASGGNGGKRL